MDETAEKYLPSIDGTFNEITTTSQPIRLCDMCHNDPWKYRCPKCSFRTCSLSCSKEHKVKYDCSGERDNSFDVIKRLVDYSSSVAVDDEKFLNSVTTSLNNATERLAVITNANTVHSVQQTEENDSKLKVIMDIAKEESTLIRHDENCVDGLENSSCSSHLDENSGEQQVTSSQVHFK